MSNRTTGIFRTDLKKTTLSMLALMIGWSSYLVAEPASSNVHYRCVTSDISDAIAVLDIKWEGEPTSLPSEGVEFKFLSTETEDSDEVVIRWEDSNSTTEKLFSISVLNGVFRSEEQEKPYTFYWYFSDDADMSNGRIYVKDADDPYFDVNVWVGCFLLSR